MVNLTLWLIFRIQVHKQIANAELHLNNCYLDGKVFSKSFNDMYIHLEIVIMLSMFGSIKL